MSLLALMVAAAAGTVSVPAPVGRPDRWLGAEDIPKGEFRAGNDGIFVVKAVVAADGKVDLCQAGSITASKEDRDAFCERLKKRARFGNATDPSGAPVYYVMEDRYAYILPENWHRFGSPQNPDAIVDVEKLPGAKDGKTEVVVNISVDAAGKLRQCNPSADAVQPTLARLACGQLTSTWAPLPERNAAGDTVPYVRQMWVEFRAKS